MATEKESKAGNAQPSDKTETPSAVEAPDVALLLADSFSAFASEIDHEWDVANFDSVVGAQTGGSPPEFVESGEPVLSGKVESEFDPSSDTDELTSPLSPLSAIITGTDDGDIIFGTHNGDRIEALDGNDFIYGRDGNDTISGGAGRDVVYGGDGRDRIYGGAGRDHLEGGNGNDTISGNNGNDTLEGGRGDNNLYGGSGSDRLLGDTGDDLYNGGSGIDTVSFAHATEGVEVALWLNGAQDTGQGLDTFINIESIEGTAYDDHIAGDHGNNTLAGGAGDDTIDGGPGNDFLLGGSGDDLLSGGEGNDIYNGGSGEDTARFTGFTNGVVVNLGTSSPQNTGEGIDTFFSIENVSGTELDDFIFGNADQNYLRGHGGNDWIWGLEGDDFVIGGKGNDVVNGGAGDDVLVGGIGYGVGDNAADAFVFGAIVGGPGNDRINDFEDGLDKVFVEAGFGVFGFSDITLASNELGHAVAYFTGGDFGGSVTFRSVSVDQIGADDFVFF